MQHDGGRRCGQAGGGESDQHPGLVSGLGVTPAPGEQGGKRAEDGAEDERD